MRVTAVSFAYPHVDGTHRAELATRLRETNIPTRDAFVLSTCLRVEVAVAGDREVLDKALVSLFGGEFSADLGVVRHDEDAVNHLYRVAAGLESPILGEHEILSQFRQSLATARNSDSIGGLFTKLLESAVAAGRQARAIMPADPHGSMAAVAAQAVGGSDRVAVLGAGAMATAVAKALAGLPAPPWITVVARTPENVVAAGVEVWPFERAVEALWTFPAVISATSATGRPISDVEMTSLVSARDDSFVLVDMAMPPDFQPPVGAAVTYIDIDDLARMADRRPRSNEVDDVVREAASEAFRQLVDHQEVGPVISHIMELTDGVVDQTVKRFAGKLTCQVDAKVLRQTAHAVARALMAKPVAYVKSADRSPDGVNAIAEAFGLSDE